jgi:hypothetical protein
MNVNTHHISSHTPNASPKPLLPATSMIAGVRQAERAAEDVVGAEFVDAADQQHDRPERECDRREEADRVGCEDACIGETEHEHGEAEAEDPDRYADSRLRFECNPGRRGGVVSGGHVLLLVSIGLPRRSRARC